MIVINQQLVQLGQINQELLSTEKSRILKLMNKYSEVYSYQTMQQLEFELELRTQIIQASYLLWQSKARFATFKTSKCNEQYWNRTEKGGFQLKENVLPASALEDIFHNGHQYAFECATAIIIVFYKGVLECIGETYFNRLFTNLLLYNGKYDEDLNLFTYKGSDFLPGDCVYFKNPDHNPDTPQWQGENAIIVEEDLYYGHGIGIRSAKGIIDALNTKRKENAEQSAFLTEYITRVDFHYLSQFYVKVRESFISNQQFQQSLNLAICQIGSKTYLA
ncbi:protein-glutamine gamma-glutamyltransferase [Priestia megaterium]|nr:protein-glutamine gamma-glutamyltransferase [Priestia megaterium]